MTEALVIYIFLHALQQILREGTRVMHEKIWKIVNYTKKYWIAIETRLNYLAINHGGICLRIIVFLQK